MSETNKKCKRMTINFRDTKEEQDLYDWIKENGVIGGDSVYVKTILYKEYLRSRK